MAKSVGGGFLLPPGEGGAERRMRVTRPTSPQSLQIEGRAALTRRSAPPSPSGRGQQSVRRPPFWLKRRDHPQIEFVHARGTEMNPLHSIIEVFCVAGHNKNATVVAFDV